jgi:maltose alpha-D-glucosyltransferase/alpha-amylase
VEAVRHGPVPRRLRRRGADSPIWIADAATRSRLLRLHLIAKALYEINYEASNRPDWIEIPVRGVLSILDDEGATA